MTSDYDLRALRAEAVCVADLAAPDRFAAIDALCSAAAARSGLAPELCGTARAIVIERERSLPTGLGQEVALPHGFVPGLDRPRLVIGRFPEGVDFQGPDGRPSRMVFLLILPCTEPARRFHLTCLGFLARILLDRGTVESMLGAPDAAALSVVWRTRSGSAGGFPT